MKHLLVKIPYILGVNAINKIYSEHFTCSYFKGIFCKKILNEVQILLT